jgi:hypothetical protein
MAERAKHTDSKDKGKFSYGKKEAPRKTVTQPKDTAKTREAKRSKGGDRERETK